MTHPVIDSSVFVPPPPGAARPPRIPVPAHRHLAHHDTTGLLPAMQSLFSIIIIAIFIILLISICIIFTALGF